MSKLAKEKAKKEFNRYARKIGGVRQFATMEVIRLEDGATVVIAAKNFDEDLHKKVGNAKPEAAISKKKEIVEDDEDDQDDDADDDGDGDDNEDADEPTGIAEMNQTNAVKFVAGSNNAAILKKMATEEKAGKKRAKVLDAIDTQIKSLKK